MLASAGMAVLAATGFATLTLVSARPVAGLDDLAAAGFGFALGGLALLPVAAAFGGIGFTPAPVTLGLLAALGTGPTAVAYTLYFRGLRTAPAGIAALLSLLEPLTGTVLAALILGDRLGPAGIAGAVILAMALILAAVAGQGAASQGSGPGPGPRHRAARPDGSPRQATARRTTAVAQYSTATQSGISTANACHTAGLVKVPAARTRAAATA